MSQRHSRQDHWIPAKDVQPEDFLDPFEVRLRLDPPPGLEFWDQPLWVFGKCEGQRAKEHPPILLTHHADDRDGPRQKGLPLKTLYPVLIHFAKEVAEPHLLVKIDLRDLEVRPRRVSPEALKIKTEREKYPELAGHGWKSKGSST